MQGLESLHIEGRRALVRVDFNVPLRDDGTILDDTRIRAALPTLEYLLERNCSCVVATHVGRPGGQRDENLRIDPVASRLVDLLPDRNVQSCDDIAGEAAQSMAYALRPGTLGVLQNLRFHPGEKADDPDLAAGLARLGDVYVNDAFAVCHRRHASVHAVARCFPAEDRAAGRLVQRETQAIDSAMDQPARPFVAVIGGAKVADKIAAMRALLDRVDHLLVGGVPAFTLLRARGDDVGGSPVEEDQLDAARELLNKAGDRLLLPVDHAVPVPRDDVVTVDALPAGVAALDIGAETSTRYKRILEQAGTVIWNGPMGHVEDPRFFAGSRSVAQAIARSDANTIVGGGDTAGIPRQLGLLEAMTHVSTGGGAFLGYLVRNTLPALQALEDH